MEPIQILLVEDNPGDVELVREGLRRGKVANSVHVSPDGVDAINFLRREGEHSAKPRPDIVLLDINLPKMNGLEVLREIRNDPGLRLLPVVILTTSDRDRDVFRSYELHANAYIMKPLNATEFIEVIRSFEHFWLTFVTMPCRGAVEPPAG